MGLSPALVHYAENIWRRFPEAFISLGLPGLEDLFELNEGSWCYRVVDTRAEKIVEIVLPRRKEGGELLGAAEDLDSYEQTSHDSPEPRRVSQLSGELSSRMTKLGFDVKNMKKSIKDCVSREVQDYLHEAGLQHGPAGVLESQAFRKHRRSPSGGALREDEADYAGDHGPTTPMPHSPTSTCSWESNLAHRRGAHVQPMAVPPRPFSGKGTVTRAPHLDRSYSRGSDGEQQRPDKASGDLQCEEMYDQDRGLEGDMISEASSPGTKVMRAARRRNQQQSSSRADAGEQRPRQGYRRSSSASSDGPVEQVCESPVRRRKG